MSKTAIVTGGSRGIGLGISRELAKRGWNLAVCATRPESELREVIGSLGAFGTDVFYARMDVSEEASRAGALDAIVERFGTIHFLVNNAGVAPEVRRDVLDMTAESYQRVMRTNLEGPFFLTQAVARLMVSQRSRLPDEPMGIVNISSISSTVASPSRGEYCLSKAGVSMATKLWAVRLAEYGIPVYEIRPGIIDTDMTSAVKEKYDRLIAEGLVPQRRWGKPEDVGRAVAMLAEGALAYSTGQVVMIDGGQLLERL